MNRSTLSILMLIFIISLFMASCASTKKNRDNYVKSKKNEFKSTGIIKDSLENVWKRTLISIAQNNFFIENSDREAGLINISFSENNPSKYITCGTLMVKDKTLTRTTKLEYDPANSFKYGKGFKPNGEKIVIVNTAHLIGKGNVLLTESKNGGTRLRVHIFYTLSTEIKYKTANTITDVVNQTYQFTTRDHFESAEEIFDTKILCQTKGILETNLLILAKPKKQLIEEEALEEDDY